MMKRRVILAVLALAVLVGAAACRFGDDSVPVATERSQIATPTAATPEATPTQRDEPEPEPTARSVAAFEEAACPFALPPGHAEGETVECGYLVVPEDRAAPDSRLIRLAVAVFRHPDGAPEPDPIIYLEGGPGGSALEMRVPAIDAFLAPMFGANRDVVLFDQRGVGYSDPALDCPEYTELYLDLLDFDVDGGQVTPAERLDLRVQAFLDCADDLRSVADLTAYNTVANAADVNDLRVALGYDHVNLWGGSYGTRLALGVLRDFPEGVRSAVLDGPYTPDVDLYLETPASFDRGLSLLSSECAADADCNDAFPGLREVFIEAVETLNENPASLEIVHPLTGEPLLTKVDGNGLAELVFRSLYDAAMVPALPQAIHDAAGGSVVSFARTAMVDILRQEFRSWGMYFSVLCHEELPYSGSWPEFQDALADYPEFSGFFEGFEVGGLAYRVCPGWGAGQADPLEDEPIASDIPTLILTGQYDPIVPPGWGEQAARHLKQGYFAEFPGAAHGVGEFACPREMVLAFLDDPAIAPDGSCVDTMASASFVVPAAAADVRLEPYISEDLAISTVVPVGWTEARPGLFVRASSAVDIAALQLATAPLKIEDVPEAMAENFGLDGPLESSGERSANGLVWSLYAFEIEGVARDLAAAGYGEIIYIVLVRSAPGERDTLFEAVLLPIIDSLVPLD